MFMPRLKKPKLCLLWALPLIAALGIDIFIWTNGGVGFHFAEIGYLIQHYTPSHDVIAAAIDHPAWRQFLTHLFHTKAALVGLMIALPPILWINRPRRMEEKPSFPRFRR